MPLHDWTKVSANDYHHFHGRWIYSLTDALNGGRLPPDHYAMADHTVPPVVPDVLTLQTGSDRITANGTYDVSGGTVATVTASPPRVTFTATEQALKREVWKQRRILIYHAEDRQIVAVIEIVSPSNKAKKSELTTFVQKAVALLRQKINLLVIDPFPATTRDPNGIHALIWKALVKKPYIRPADKPIALSAYAAKTKAYTAYVEPVAVGDVLPEMPLFLDPERYVNVPLEPTYLSAWDGFPRQLRGRLEPCV